MKFLMKIIVKRFLAENIPFLIGYCLAIFKQNISFYTSLALFLCDFGTNALINKVGLTRPVSLYK